MKHKIIYFLVALLICGSVQYTCTTIGSAQAQLSLLDTFTYQLVKNETIGNLNVRTYTFSVNIHNSGDQTSDLIEVKFEEPEIGGFITLGNGTIAPGENQTFLLEEWPTVIIGDVTMNFSFNPVNPDTLPTEFNSGKKTFIIPALETNVTETPGFELVFVVIAILVVLLRNTRKK